MAEYSSGTYTINLGTFQINGKKFPITVVDLDVGADLAAGDRLLAPFLQEIADRLYGAISILAIYGLTTRVTETFGGLFPFQDQQYTILADDGTYALRYRRLINAPRTRWIPEFTINGSLLNGHLYYQFAQTDLSIGPIFLIRDARTNTYIGSSPSSNGPYVYGQVFGGSGDPFGVVSANGAPSGFIDQFAQDYSPNRGSSAITVSINAAANAMFNAIVDLRIITDPYTAGGTTEEDGGDGTYTNDETPVPVPDLPTVSAADTGFITLFSPTLAQLRNLASYMWSSLFDVAGWQKLYADPMDAILGLSIVPVQVPVGGTREVKVGNIGTGIFMTVATSQYVTVDCGSLDVREYWGAYLDYSPYTKAELYLPYCGTHPIDIDDIMRRNVRVVYHVDILSGSCCAHVQCGDTVLYSFAGQCSSSIPINANNWTSVVNGALSIAASVGTMVATGGLSAPISGGAAVAAGASLASTAMTMKPKVERSGSMGGTAGLLGIQKPYLILTRPRQALPLAQNEYTGYPSYMTVTLGDLTGYTTVAEIHLEGVPCTEGEAEEIVSILKSGVIL